MAVGFLPVVVQGALCPLQGSFSSLCLLPCRAALLPPPVWAVLLSFLSWSHAQLGERAPFSRNFQGISPAHKTMAMWLCSGFRPTFLLTMLRLVTSLCLADWLISYVRKDWKDGNNIYCDFKRTSTSTGSKRNVPPFQFYISFIQKMNTSVSVFFFSPQSLNLSVFSDKSFP